MIQAEASPLAAPRVDVWGLAKYCVAVHAGLPFVIWWAGAIDPMVTTWAWVGAHVLFPVFLLFTYPYWKGQGVEVAVLIVLNHAVTFVVGTALIYFVG
jgi:hypothetical protein